MNETQPSQIDRTSRKRNVFIAKLYMLLFHSFKFNIVLTKMDRIGGFEITEFFELETKLQPKNISIASKYLYQTLAVVNIRTNSVYCQVVSELSQAYLRNCTSLFRNSDCSYSKTTFLEVVLSRLNGLSLLTSPVAIPWCDENAMYLNVSDWGLTILEDGVCLQLRFLLFKGKCMECYRKTKQMKRKFCISSSSMFLFLI